LQFFFEIGEDLPKLLTSLLACFYGHSVYPHYIARVWTIIFKKVQYA